MLSVEKYVLFFKLLSASCDQDLQIRTLLGECLGELGAIDPKRYQLYSPNDNTVVTICVHCRLQVSTVIVNKQLTMHEVMYCKK